MRPPPPFRNAVRQTLPLGAGLALLLAVVQSAVAAAGPGDVSSAPQASGALSCGEASPACDKPAFEARAFDHRVLHGLLAKYVRGVGVAYREWRASAGDLARLLEYVHRLGKARLAGWSRAEKLAFYINAYNAITLQSVLAAYPVPSIKSIPGVWTGRKWRVAGRRLTLDQIEHAILRKRFREPRIHFALVCASKGCPPLQPWAFTGAKTNQRLAAVTRSFLNSPKHTRVDLGERRLVLSSIFEWFATDFTSAAGSVPAFVARYRTRAEATELKRGTWSVTYSAYDWSLNEAE